MAWFEDERLRDIYETGRARGVSSEDCVAILLALTILTRSRSRMSHWVAGKPFSMPDGRSAVQVTRRWAITFEWIEDVGPFRMQLVAM